MHLQVSDSPSPDWNVVLTSLDGNIYQSSEWARSVFSQYQKPLFLSWFEGERCVGLAVGVKRWSHLPVVGKFIKHLSFESYPVVKDGSSDLLTEIVQQLVNYAQKEGYLSLSVNSFLTDNTITNEEQLELVSSQRIEFSIDLKKSDDELFKGLATRHKRKLKKAQKHGLTLQEAETIEAMREFRKLQIQSRDRRMENGEFIGLMEDSFYEDLAKNYFREKLGRVFLMVHDGQPVSAAFVSMYQGKGYYVYGGSSDAGFKLNAPPLLFMNIFSRCRELGCSEFNMGGVPASSTQPDALSHGLYLFKAGFGGREIKCYNLLAEDLQPVRGSLVNLFKRIKN